MTYNSRIIHIRDEEQFGLIHRFMFGLQIFQNNGFLCSLEQRPDVLFLRRLSTQMHCAAQVGAITLDGLKSPETIFGSPKKPLDYFETQIGVHDGFFDLTKIIPYTTTRLGGCTIRRTETFGDCFFPRVTSEFWQTLLTLPAIFFVHGLVLYVDPVNSPEETDAEMRRLLLAPFPGNDRWLQAVTDLYKLIVVAGHDFEYFRIWANHRSHFDLLDIALAETEADIVSSEWFQANKEHLIFDEYPSYIPVRLPNEFAMSVLS